MASQDYYRDLIRVSYGLPPMGTPMSMEGKPEGKKSEREASDESTGGFDKEAQNLLFDATSEVVSGLAKRRQQKKLEKSLGDLSQGMEGVDTAYDSAMGTEEAETPAS